MSNLVSDSSQFTARVSSVLNRNVKEFGKKFLFDGREDSCWNSEQGSPQWVQLTFEEPKAASELQLMFQGGFAGKNCWLETEAADGGELTKFQDFYPEDTNKLQTFKFDSAPTSRVFRVVFSDSTDFFGRVTIYQMNLISV